ASNAPSLSSWTAGSTCWTMMASLYTASGSSRKTVPTCRSLLARERVVNPVVDVFVKEHRLTLATVVWQDGTPRTIAASSSDLVTIGIMAHSGKSPEEFDAAFPGRLVAEPKGQADVLRIAVERSEN